MTGDEFTLTVDADGFRASGQDLESRAEVWLPPGYHRRTEVVGRPFEHFVFTHADRVRLSPIRGCSMKCRFCITPYEDPYELTPLEAMVASLRYAFDDEPQPAHHALISGGTPAERDHGRLQEIYREVLTAFPETDIDIMMVPVGRCGARSVGRVEGRAPSRPANESRNPSPRGHTHPIDRPSISPTQLRATQALPRRRRRRGCCHRRRGCRDSRRNGPRCNTVQLELHAWYSPG